MDQGKRLHNVRCEPFWYNAHCVRAMNVFLPTSHYLALSNNSLNYFIQRLTSLTLM